MQTEREYVKSSCPNGQATKMLIKPVNKKFMPSAFTRTVGDVRAFILPLFNSQVHSKCPLKR